MKPLERIGASLRLVALFWLAHARARPGRVLMSIVVLAVGIALGLGVSLVNNSALQEFRSSLARIHGEADLSLRARAGVIDDTLYDRLAADPAVAAASPVISFDAQLLDDDGRVRSDEPIPVLALDPLRAAELTPALMPRASSPVALFDTDAIFLSPALMRQAGASVGDALVLRAGPHEQRLVVTGELPGITGGQRLAVIDLATAQWRFGWAGKLERIDLRIDPPSSAAALRARWHDALPTAVWSTPAMASSRMANLSRAYRVNLSLLALVALVTGLFLIHANLALASQRQWPEFALLATLGASRTTVAAAVLGQGLMIGVGGALLGCVLGTALAWLALAIIGGDLGAGLLQTREVALALDGMTLGGFVLLGIAAGLASSIAPALRTRTLAPAQALRGLGEQARPGSGRRAAWSLVALAGGGAALALPPIAALPLGAYLTIAIWLVVLAAGSGTLLASGIRLLARRPGLGWPLPALWLGLARLRERPGAAHAALAGVIASVALAAAMVTMVHSFRAAVVHWLDVVLPADIYARMSTAGPAGGIDTGLEPAIRAVPGVAALAWMRVRQIDLDPDKPTVALLARELSKDSPERDLPLTDTARAVPTGCTAVFGSEAMIDLYGWHPGARVTLPFGAPAHCFVVSAIWRDYARQHGSIVIDRQAYQVLSGDEAASDLAVRLAPGADAVAVIKHLRALDPGLAGLQWRAADDIRAMSLAIFDRSFAATYALEAVAVLLGVLGVAAGYSAEALARRREFGVLQHLGMSTRQIARLFMSEAAVLTSLGCLLGLALGAAFAMILVYRVNPVSFHWRMDIVWPVGPLVVGAASLTGIAVLTAGAIAVRAMRRQSPASAVRADW